MISKRHNGQKQNLLKVLCLFSSASALIACNSGSNNSDRSAENIPDDGSSSQSVKLVPGQSAVHLENYLKGGLKHSTRGGQYALDDTAEGDTANAAPETALSGASNSDRFSGTNTQVLGVDEADLVKYDGDYLFIASNEYAYYLAADATIGNTSIADDSGSTDIGFADEPFFAPSPSAQAKIRILQTVQGDTPSATEVQSLTLDEKQGTIAGLYLQKNTAGSTQLAVLSNNQSFAWESWLRYDYWGSSYTYLTLYDVSTPANSKVSWSIDIEGSLIDSRRINDKLYLVTRYVPEVPGVNWYAHSKEDEEKNQQAIEALTLDDLLPKMTDASGTNVPLVSSDNCYVPESAQEDYYSPALVTITTINLNNPSDITSVCVGGYSSGIFSSTESLYLFNDQWNQGTIIHKFSFTDQGTAYKGTGTVKGSLGWRAPSFRLTEKDGALVAVSTVFPDELIGIATEPALLEDTMIVADDMPTVEQFSPTHQLSVLKENDNNELVTVATLPNSNQPAAIGKPNEDIYAVRFIGDRGYIVTYQKTDPLYVIDLSTVTSPVIAGELHIEGYSDYLHPIGEQYLIGIGKSAIVEGDIAWYQGVQVGMFDVNDITAPSLIKQISIGSRGTETEVSYNHKAFSFLELDADSFRMTLPMHVHNGTQRSPSDWTNWQYTGLHLFDIELNGTASLEEAGSIIASSVSKEMPYNQYVNTQRGIMHDDAVHYVYGEKVISANWNDLKATTTVAQ